MFSCKSFGQSFAVHQQLIYAPGKQVLPKRYAGGCPGQPGDAAVQQCDIQGACQHCDDQVLMVGGLRVHGCVRLIHTIVPFTPGGLLQCMHDAAIR